MISSMTGFSAVAVELEWGTLSLEIRGVNQRHLDLQFRIPEEIRQIEPVLREHLSAHITRGKVECRIQYIPHPLSPHPARLNQSLLQQLVLWNDEVKVLFPNALDLSVAEVLKWDGIFINDALPDNLLHSHVINLLQQALLEFNASRNREGDKLKLFLQHRIAQINRLRIDIAPRIPATIIAYEAKLRPRLLDALGNHDNERIHQEISLFASKIDVDEELSRLHAHLSEMERVLEQGGCVGKRLDFLMQELHREANTLGAKSVDTTISRAAMEMKILIEQMREQIQNLE